MKIPCVKKPCKDCPFREDSMEGWLGKARAKEIAEAQSFVCHRQYRLTVRRSHDNARPSQRVCKNGCTVQR